MRWLAALALAACSSPARAPEPHHPARAGAVVPAAAAPEVKPIPTVHALRDVSEAPHAGTIMTLAVSPDGNTVLTADELGGVRLWPTVDGSAEPRIVDMPIAKQLAIGKLASGYSAAALDEAGGIYIAKLDTNGRQVAHTSLPAEPPVIGMAMSELGLIAWRADQTIALIDGDGATQSRIGTEPQQRLVALAVNGKRAVALLDREGTKRQARWLTMEPKLAWGAWIKLDLGVAGSPADIALSPNGKRLAMLVRPTVQTANVRIVAPPRGGTATVYDLAAPSTLATGPFNSLSADVAFADDDHAVFGGFEGLAWIDLTKKNAQPSPLSSSSPGSRRQAALGAGAGHAITPMNGDLVISTPTGQQFLGYDTVSPRIAEAGPDGQLMVGVADHLLLLDKNLQASTTTPFTGVTGVVAELRWIGGGDWLVESSTPTDGTLQVNLVGNHGATTVRRGLKEVQILGYEPSTNLVTFSFGTESEVARYVAKTRKLEAIATAKKASPYEQVLFVPVAPSLARGIQLLQITMKDRTTIKWLRDAEAPNKPAASVTVEGPFAGADAAGHVYMWRNTPAGQLELVVYQEGKVVSTLPNTGAIALWPEPNGKRYIEVAQTSVAMYDLDGKQLWLQQLATSQEALWLSDGAIAITSAGGVARLDPATGAVTAARCGWRFGLASKPHPATPRVEPLCSQLRR